MESMIEAHAANMDAIKDADSEMPLLPLDKPAIEDTYRLFVLEDSEIDLGRTRDLDIILMDIIQSCLKDLMMPKLHNYMHTIKMLLLLSAVSEYVKLCLHYRSIKVCNQPCLNVSVTIVRQMGRSIYFAHQICYNSLYLLKHHHLPLHKKYTQNGQYSLLNNEAVLHDVHVYLIA
jgi:hypothetical protein